MDLNRTGLFPRFNWGWGITVFFILLAVANSLILYLAISSNPGALVENPYVEGLKFQRQLDARALFSTRGYSFSLAVTQGGGGVTGSIEDRAGQPVANLTGSLKLVFLGDSAADRSCDLVWSREAKAYPCVAQLSRTGLWVVEAQLREGEQLMEYRDTRPLTF